MSTLIKLLERSFEKYAKNDAIFYNQNDFSYERINEAINRLARGLIELGIKKDDRVVILLPNLVHFPISYFATIKIGAIAVPMNFLFSGTLLRSQIQTIAPKAVITWYNILSKLEWISGMPDVPIIVLGENIPPNFISLTKLLATTSPMDTSIDVEDNDPATIVYTAGNTGDPKGVVLTHGAIAANCLSFRHSFMLNPNERFVSALPLFTAISQIAILNAAFMSGAKVILHPSFDSEAISSLIESQQGTIIIGNSAMYRSFLDAPITKDSLKSLKYCISYGDTFQQETLDAFEEKFDQKIFESYGLCEASTFVTLNRTNGEHRKGSVGLPIDGLYLKILNEHGKPVPENEVGEICIQGPNLMKGYFCTTDKNQTAGIDNDWLFTGDLGKLDSEGYLYILERMQNVITKAGFMVFPKEIEMYLLTHPKISEVSVIGVPEPPHGEDIKACIVLKKDQTTSAAEIIEYCQQRLELYKCPKYVQFFQTLPKSPTGRILKFHLQEKQYPG